MSHTKHTINTETERNPIFRNDSQLYEYETLFSIIEGFRQQKVGSCQVSLPLCLCAMLAHSGGLSVSPLQDWFMASISMFMRCHRPATKKKKEKNPFFTVTQQEWVLQCSTEVQTDRGWSYIAQSRRQLSWHSRKWRLPDEYGIMCLLNPTTKSTGRQWKSAICWVTAITCEHQSKRVKQTHSPPDF